MAPDPRSEVAGRRTVSFWSPLDPVKQASLRCVAGSHRWPKEVLPKRWLADTAFYPDPSKYMEVPDPDAEGMDVREWQMEPGDYDAMVSPGPIVNRKSEHLGTTDRGVVTIRRMLTHAINALRDGNTPAIPRLYPGESLVRTYAHEIVLRLPTTDGLADRQVLADFGRRAAKVFIDMDDIPDARRDAVARERIDVILRECCGVGEPAMAKV